MLLIALLVAIADPGPPAQATAENPVTTTRSGLRFQVLRPGTGRRPGPRDAVLVRYEGRLADGTVFDTTADPVGLRVADLVPGFAEAMRLMNEGGRYRFWVPPRLGYGAHGSPGVVPPNAELDFTLELLRIGRPAGPARR
jgi:FKBP-type peptidyl-prolyl cis-trans isomerase FkpA